MSVPVESPRLPHWQRLRSGDRAVVDELQRQATELARALAVESVAADPDADLSELEDRRRYLLASAWPDPPTEGYGLHASLGAFVLARVALDWVPSGHTGLRRAPLDGEGVRRALEQHGVEPATAAVVVGNWPACDPGFTADVAGLEPSVLAGLAERSLTPDEAKAALSQVASSNRDLFRLAACLNLTRGVRQLLAVLPSDEAVGAEVAGALALLATGRPERALETLPDAVTGPGAQTVRELASAWLAWASGESIALPGLDPSPVVAQPAELSAASERSADAAPGTSAGLSGEDAAEEESADEDDVLEILEERVDGEGEVASSVGPSPWRGGASPEVPDGWPRDPLARCASPWASLGEAQAPALAWDTVLGLAPQRSDDRGAPLPADPRFGPFEDVPEGSSLDAFLVPARWALRVVAAGAEGEVWSEGAPASARGLQWVVARATALAELGAGRWEAALAALDGMSEAEAPERGWIESRRIRYRGRLAERLEPAERRAMATTLVADLGRALARTLAGEPATSAGPGNENSDGGQAAQDEGQGVSPVFGG